MSEPQQPFPMETIILAANVKAALRRMDNHIDRIIYLSRYRLEQLNSCALYFGRKKPGKNKQVLSWWIVNRLHPNKET